MYHARTGCHPGNTDEVHDEYVSRPRAEGYCQAVMGADCALLVACSASLQVSCHALITVTLRLKASHPPLLIAYFLTSHTGKTHPRATTAQHPKHGNDISQFSQASFIPHAPYPSKRVQRGNPLVVSTCVGLSPARFLRRLRLPWCAFPYAGAVSHG